ncbi:hypothetical protein DNC80_07865 [Flavobacterium sp. SOK18b]|uniref:hypothetical protein n=1 Tax=Flavobacterium sp. SOK18b TaxID=797900 RepID=UPI0015FD0553|nr:hypothetical protein [Flavobacterium sp. SOK18b]MBB1193583.1 hypothetical protein [Flavobacterium sp. SOK18b]
MKKIIALALLWASFLSCSPDNDYPNYSYEVLPVASYEVPASFKLGETYTITLKYQKPSSCYEYQGIYYDKNLNVRTIGIQAVVDKDQICNQALPPLSEVSFQFYVTNTGSYIFKFYKGKDANGVSQFEEKEIKVEN